MSRFKTTSIPKWPQSQRQPHVAERSQSTQTASSPGLSSPEKAATRYCVDLNAAGATESSLNKRVDIARYAKKRKKAQNVKNHWQVRILGLVQDFIQKSL